MVSAETLRSYPDWKLPFTVHNDGSDKRLGAVIIQKSKPIAFFSKILIKPQRNYTTTEKKRFAVVECCKQFQRFFFSIKEMYSRIIRIWSMPQP